MYHYLCTKGKKLSYLATVLLSLCVLTLTGFRASASEVPAPETATGTVIDQYGDPLPGASIMVIGTTKGTSTDIDGNFSIQGVERGQTLRISMVGCKPVEVKWEGTPLGITMEDDAQALDEVVVVGFGTQKRANLTGAVSSISSKELANRPVASAVDALSGLAPGLTVGSSAVGGQLSGTKSINIRGTGTIGDGSTVSPLILIDGMEGDLNAINPQDIESISILKDAAAASIYGIRAAGGVILVTTKNGKEGKVQVTYSDSFCWSRPINLPHMMNAYQWSIYFNTAFMNSGQGVLFSDDKLQQMKDAVDNGTLRMWPDPGDNTWKIWGMADDADILPTGNTDWLWEHYGKTAFSQEHNVSVTAGNEKVNTYFSANVLSQDGIMRYGDENRQRYNLTGRINYQITDWLLMGYSARWSRTNYDSPSILNGEGYNSGGYNSMYWNIARYWPIVPVKDLNGYYVVESYVEAIQNGGRYKSAVDLLDHQFSFLINPIEGLNINAEFNYRSNHSDYHRYWLQTGGWNVDGVYYDRNPNDWPVGAPTGTQVYDRSYRSNYFNPNIYGTYQFSIADAHDFKVMAGYQSEWFRQNYFNASRNDIQNDLPFLGNTTSTTNYSMGGGTDSWSTAGFFGRINYDYKGRYLVEGNIRYDGTSRFRKGHRWSWSPSFSLGWNIANEAWFEDLRQIVTTLKPRYSWGKLGNQNTNNWYPTYSAMGFNQTGSNWLVNGQRTATASMPSLVSSTLTWEKLRTWNIGLDWGLFNNRLTGSFDYYNRKTEDMVGPGVVMPGVLGASVPKTNNLSMTSKGWELTISWRDRIQDFTYGISANLYDHTMTVDYYPNDAYNLNSYYSGMKMGEIWGLTTVGIAKTQEEMDAHLAKVNQNMMGSGWGAGDIMYADIDGDGVLSYGNWTLDDHGDYSVIGNTTPRYNFGLNLDAQWKGFDIRIFFQGVGKRDYDAGYNGGAMFWGATAGIGFWQAVGFEGQLDYFRPADTTDPLGPNLDSYYPKPDFAGGRNQESQTRYIQNAAYCSLKNLTLGYTIPQHITRKAYIENLRVFFSGENLAKITNFTKMGDPEMIDGAYQTGFGRSYPLSRVLSVGLNVTF